MSNHNFKNLIWILIIVASVMSNVTYAEGLPPLTHELTIVNSKKIAPELKFQDLDENTINIKDLKGKVVIVNFWATWCPPCRREMGSMEKLYQATKDKNVEILAVNIGEDVDTVFSFLGTIEPSPTFKILFDTEADSMGRWNVKGLPTTYIVGPDGTLAYQAVGGREFDHPNIQQKIKRLIE